MKRSERRRNTFQGSYYGYHDEMDWEKTPLYLKLLLFFTIFIIFGGVGASIYMGILDNVEWMMKSILLTIAVSFILIHMMVVFFDIAKYGKIRKNNNCLGTIFSTVGICILAGVLLSEVISLWILLGAGLILVFFSIGIRLWIVGEKKIKRIKTVCTQSVMATCTGFETLNPHLPILNDKNATFAQNEMIGRTEVMKPVWEFEYQGERYRAVPEEYQGSLNVKLGKEYQIFINPENPQDIYSEDSSNAKFLVRMGKIFIIFTGFIIILMIGILYLFSALLGDMI